jgi:GT2 family glycosyltransferase
MLTFVFKAGKLRAKQMANQQESAQLSVSIVVVSWNNKKDLQELLDSLAKQNYPKLEIIVVDNASTDGTLETLKKYPDLKVLALQKNCGLHAGFNYGVSKAKGDVIIGTDQDCIIKDPTVASKVAKAYLQNPKLGVLAFRVRSLFSEEDMWDNPMHLEEGNAERGFFSLGFNGAGFAVPKKVCLQIGGYDEQFFIYHGEIDLTLRAMDLGYQCRYFPDIAVYHKAVGHKESDWYYGKTKRNYEWFLLKNFPVSEYIRVRVLPLIWELRRHPFSLPKLAYENLKTLRDALSGLPQVLGKRKRLSKKTIQYFEYMRVKGVR